MLHTSCTSHSPTTSDAHDHHHHLRDGANLRRVPLQTCRAPQPRHRGHRVESGMPSPSKQALSPRPNQAERSRPSCAPRSPSGEIGVRSIHPDLLQPRPRPTRPQNCHQRRHVEVDAEDATTTLPEQDGDLGPDASQPHRHRGRQTELDATP
jgi:hypothetical protein